MNKRKICVVITARPSYARIKSALRAMLNNPKIELQIVLAGSALLDKYGNIEKILQKDGFKINKKIYYVLESDAPITMCKTTGVAILELSTVFQSLNPDVVVTVADRRNNCYIFSGQLSKYSFGSYSRRRSIRKYWWKTRHANTKLADIHLVSNENARERVIKMGEEISKVINTGCPSIDIARDVLENPEINFDPIKKYGGKWKYKLLSGYLVVLQHPVTEFMKSKEQMTITLQAIQDLDIPTFWLWPNLDIGTDNASKAIRLFREKNNIPNIHFFKNLEPQDFLKLIKNSKCFIGNSSAGIREGAFLGVPAVNIGTRQNRRMRGKNVIDCDYNKDEIISAINKQLSSNYIEKENIYGDGYSGKKISDYLETCELDFKKQLHIEGI